MTWTLLFLYWCHLLENRYFSRSEFACGCGCGFDTVDTVTLELITLVRQHFNAAVTVTSAARCTKYNASVGGGKESQHLRGRACDIVVHGVDPTQVYAFLETRMKGWGGLGKYDDFTHVDSRTGCARW